MAFEFKLPDVGEGVTEGEIVAWHVQPGETIEEDQTMVEVMTDKATVTIPSPVTGTVLECRGDVGDIVPVYSVLVVIDTDGTGAEAETETETETEAEPEAKTETKTETETETETETQTQTATATARPALPPAPLAAQTQRILATPATRRIARELGVDLASVTPTGKNGRTTRDDVVRLANAGGLPAAVGAQTVSVPSQPIREELPGLPPAAARPPATPPPTRAPVSAVPAPAPTAPRGSQRIPIRGLRRRIADKMRESWQHAVHFTFVEEADVSRLVDLRRRMNLTLETEGIKLSFLPFIVKAVCTAMRRHPNINSWIDEAAQEVIQHEGIHVGIAVATDRGLMVPVVHDADRMTLKQLGAEIARLADAARTGKATMEELTGSTFTITSLGAQGGLLATPILNHPEVAILGVHRIRKRPWVVGDGIEARDIITISGSFDHRIIDGHMGAAYIYDVLRYLEDPEQLMLELV